ncbi:MAG: hypothetical protein WED04_09110 [Promethearchaeati archaeon SRVP18_Atabeyarchaeia-1]
MPSRLDFLEPDERKREKWGWGQKGGGRSLAALLGLFLIVGGTVWMVLYFLTMGNDAVKPWFIIAYLGSYPFTSYPALLPFYPVMGISMIVFGSLLVVGAYRLSVRGIITVASITTVGFVFLYFA